MKGDQMNLEAYRTTVRLSSVIRGARRPLLLLLLLVARMTSEHLVEEIKLRRNIPDLEQGQERQNGRMQHSWPIHGGR